MKSIAIVTGEKAYLPEKYAYKTFFEKHGFQVKILSRQTKTTTEQFDIIWTFMGVDTSPKIKGKVFVHEYQSIPVDGSLVMRTIKARLKKSFSKKPDLRIFKNKAVDAFFNFKDDVPCLYRDMGVQSQFFEESTVEKKFDFVYLGEMSRVRNTDKLIRFFNSHLSEYTLLLIGEVPDYLKSLLQNSEFITTTGKLSYHEIPALLHQCVYGFHYVPDRYPFNVQLSTKLIEYCAAGLNILSNRSLVVEEFQEQYGGKFYLFDEDFRDFHIDALKEFNFVTPDVRSLEWDILLDRSGILQALKQFK